MKWRRSSTDSMVFGMKSLGVTLGILMFVVWQHVEARHLERRLGAMRKEADALVFQNARMQSQINQLASPSHLEAMARKDLGMVPLDAQHRIAVEIP